MTTESRLIALATLLGQDIATLAARDGNLADLPTANKTTFVAAIAEIYQMAQGSAGGTAGAAIDDMAGDGNTTVTWSADKIFDSIQSAMNTLRDSILGGAGAAFDTLQELATALGSDPNFATTITAELANRVRFDQSQTLTAAQKLQACQNIGIGDPEADLVAAYTTARGTI
ncbi:MULTISPECIES: hypothetical protein [unclassified Pseudomonas]|uniref:hypothetical protein n=1 Tax=unclassified Pseudomonas TaxID=196821 RepID=UPI001C60C2DB|nr:MULTISPECIES: hypothetical protein [unclassified Pseudomonas]MBW5416102.1 hypothetical protein [Pseudomonas sp. MAG002Y]